MPFTLQQACLVFEAQHASALVAAVIYTHGVTTPAICACCALDLLAAYAVAKFMYFSWHVYNVLEICNSVVIVTNGMC